jgi:hypothetical protein
MDMPKKLSVSLIIVLIVAMLTSSLVLAAEQPASAAIRPGSRFGVVFSISKDSFTLKNAGGKEKTILVSPTTRFVKINGDAKAFKNLGVGQWAMAFGTINESKELDAKVVVLAPRRFNRGDWSGPRQYGQVLSVDPANNSLRVNTSGGFLTFAVDDDTHYPGRVKGLGGVQAGMTVFLGYEQGKNGMLKVKALIAVP